MISIALAARRELPGELRGALSACACADLQLAVIVQSRGWLFTLPAAGIKFVFQQVADIADTELNDESTVHEQLLLLQVQLEEGDITDDEYVEREAELMQRLREIKARKREQQQALASEVPPEADVTARRRMVIETPFDQD